MDVGWHGRFVQRPSAELNGSEGVRSEPTLRLRLDDLWGSAEGVGIGGSHAQGNRITVAGVGENSQSVRGSGWDRGVTEPGDAAGRPDSGTGDASAPVTGVVRGDWYAVDVYGRAATGSGKGAAAGGSDDGSRGRFDGAASDIVGTPDPMGGDQAREPSASGLAASGDRGVELRQRSAGSGDGGVVDVTPAPEPAVVPAPGNQGNVVALILAQPWPADEAIAVARCESGLNPRAYNAGNYGLFQISYVHAGRVGGALASLFDAATNIAVAYRIWFEQGWAPWACRP